jgi:hypothetical protein
MTCEPCISSQAQEADSLPTLSLDTRQLSLLSGIDMPAKSCENEPPKDGSLICTCGKATSDCSIHPNTPEKWIASMRDSLARTLAFLESRQAYLREPDQVFTAKSCALLTQFDPSTSSWRTLQQSFLTDSEPFLETWPRVGMTQGGCAYVHPMSERRITETDGGCWPTPDTRGFVNEGSLAMLTEMCDSREEYMAMAHRASKSKKARFWPSPTAHNAKETAAPSEGMRNTPTLAHQAGGQLNPEWVEWLMGWPIGWTDSRHWATVKSRSKQQSLGNSLEASK